MFIRHELNDINSLSKSVIAFGNFDGLHLGHQKIINKVKELSRINNCKSVVLTFNPHTKVVLQKNDNYKTLTNINQKANILKNMGIDVLCEIKFDETYSNLSYKKFLNILINKYNPLNIVLGYDNKFRKNRIGEYSLLDKDTLYEKIDFTHINPYSTKNMIIKTSLIKDMLLEGDILNVNKYLGRKYSINGVVIKGNAVGKKIGFPTANIDISKIKQLIPMNGVYSVNLKFDKRQYKSVCNIGYKPTLQNNKKLSVEVHIIDKNINLYDKYVELEFENFIRNEKKFNNVDELIVQIKNDIDLLKNKGEVKC